MAVLISDIKHCEAQYMPANDTDTVGGEKTSSEVASAIGGVFHRVVAESEGGGEVHQYKKTFLCNINETDDLTDCAIWLANGLDDVASDGTVTITSASEDDDDTYIVRVVGLNDSTPAEIITEDIICNGTTPATGTRIFSAVNRAELRYASTGALAGANGDITIEADSVVLGIIPEGSNCALAIVDVGITSSLDDDSTTADALTAPASISFSRPRDEAGALDVANSGTLSAESGQGIWWRLTVPAGIPPAPELEIKLELKGVAL